MLTTRGWWFFFFLLVFLIVALVTMTPPLVLVSLTLLSWFLGSWLLFVVKLRLVQGKLRLARAIADNRGPLTNLWAGVGYRVQVQLFNDSPITLPYVFLRDRMPVVLELREGSMEIDGPIGSNGSLGLGYQVVCPTAGRLRFDGLSVQIADLQGFFWASIFVRALYCYRVLPPLNEGRGRLQGVKRHNLLPLLGAHRHRRPGTGSELLDLRDYLPGDPPKTIAWKVSARRDRLMTKEYESEVPLRCTLFVDVSSSVRVGDPGSNALARLVAIAAAVAQAAVAVRDLTGLCLCDEVDQRLLKPGRGNRHLIKLAQELADVAMLPPPPVQVPLAPLLPLAYGLAEEVYPELLRPEVNAFPWWLPWLSPQPAWTMPSAVRPRFTLLDSIRARLSGHRRRLYRWRKRLAALLAVHYQLGPGALALLLENDASCSFYAQKFLADHQVAVPLPFYDEAGRYLFAAPGKVPVLTTALLRAVARGRDNELFVLLADLLELDNLGPLLRAIQVALARHHQVMVICPWPAGMSVPDREGLPAAREEKRSWSAAEEIQRVAAGRFQHAFLALRQRLAGLGVPLVCAAELDAAALVVQRLQKLRTLAGGGR